MNAAPPEAGLLASLRGLLLTLLTLLRTRGELLVVELEEEKSRIFETLLLGATAFFFISFGLVMLAIFLTVLLWESNRLLLIGIFTALFLGIGIAALTGLRHALRQGAGTRLFSASLRELASDEDALRTAKARPASPADEGHGY